MYPVYSVRHVPGCSPPGARVPRILARFGIQRARRRSKPRPQMRDRGKRSVRSACRGARIGAIIGESWIEENK